MSYEDMCIREATGEGETRHQWDQYSWDDLGIETPQTETPNVKTDTQQGKTRSKAEIKAERLSYAMWAAGVYKREHHFGNLRRVL